MIFLHTRPIRSKVFSACQRADRTDAPEFMFEFIETFPALIAKDGDDQKGNVFAITSRMINNGQKQISSLVADVFFMDTTCLFCYFSAYQVFNGYYQGFVHVVFRSTTS